MADLSFLNNIGTVAAIDRHHEKSNKPRTRLGLSQAGHPCKRLLWYAHQGIPGTQPEGRILRLFRLGDAIERLIIGDLCSAGCQVYHQQQEVEFTQGETRLVGHIDGKVVGLRESPETPHLLECKSASKKRFDELVKFSDYAKWDTVYGWQVQFYMLGLGLTRACCVVYCKDDSRIYLERIPLNREAAIERLRDVFAAITSPIEPDRICPRADDYRAKFCPYHHHCWGL
mgnify:CR=1 FL=1